MKRVLAATVAALLTMLLGAGSASAAAPVASTGGVGSITSSGAKLNGSVDPNGERTTYYFEYGTTTRYGSRTPDGATGTGTSAVKVSATIGGLAPNTTYHYRLVASNPSGVDAGSDRTFKTKPQPLGLQIAANPGNPVTFGSPAVISGTLTGTGNGGRQVVLQARTFPYTAAFAQVGNPVVTADNGNFSFTLLPQTINTQYRVQTVAKPAVTSPILNLGVAVRVATNVTKTRVKRGRTVRFFGTIKPARAGAQFAVQREKTPGVWQNVAGGITHGTGDSSSWSKRVKIRRGGNYRVFVLIIDGNYVSGIGRTVKLRSFK